jgi:hypothetical protein
MCGITLLTAEISLGPSDHTPPLTLYDTSYMASGNCALLVLTPGLAVYEPENPLMSCRKVRFSMSN